MENTPSDLHALKKPSPYRVKIFIRLKMMINVAHPGRVTLFLIGLLTIIDFDLNVFLKHFTCYVQVWIFVRSSDSYNEFSYYQF